VNLKVPETGAATSQVEVDVRIRSEVRREDRLSQEHDQMSYPLPLSVASLATLLLAAVPAYAHVSLAEPEAFAGSSYVAAFRVSHACGDSPTVRLRVEIPEQIAGVNPRPKAGWTISIERASEPNTGGAAAASNTGRISAITWEGRLDADFFDDFGLLIKLPDTAARIYFPTIQTCASGDDRHWVQIPAAGKAWTSVPRPAPVLDVIPRAPARTAAPPPAQPATGTDHANH